MSTNVSKEKRDELLRKIQEIRTFISTAEQDENTARLLSYLSDLAKDVNGKKYGLIFEEHREEIDEVLDTHIPVLTENTDLFIDSGGQMNFLIEGDNLAALKLLGKTNRGKIDLIYIDPPYNTGSHDFIYDDSFVDNNDCFTHSKWLSFLNARLSLTRQLLSDQGVIFISIDDHEEAALKLLCDGLFTEECFVANIAWQRTYSTRNDSKGIGREVEHILVYSKRPNWTPSRLPRTKEMDEKYKNPDNDIAPWRTDNPYAPSASTHQGMVYAIQHPFTGKMLYPTNGRCWPFEQEQILEIMRGWCPYELKNIHDEEKRASVCGVPISEVRKDVYSIVLSDSLEASSKQAKLVYDRGQWPRLFFTKKGLGGIARKTYLENVGGRLPTNFWSFEETGHTDEAKKEIGRILGDLTAFSTPKPVRLIERIISIASKPDSIVLDFFAGSGTTGHAILKYNVEHENSNRRFILCTNNENNICREVTYERIRRVIEKEGFEASLKYYKVDYIPIDERMYYEYADELLLHIRELVELENGINFNGNKETAIVLTDEELAEFTENIGLNCRKLYMGHDILPDEEQQAIIAEHGVEISIIPDYYYRDLQER